jgi:hypothetical protein
MDHKDSEKMGADRSEQAKLVQMVYFIKAGNDPAQAENQQE